MEYIQAKSLIQSVSHGDKWFGVDYNMNLYRGCCHGCIYCDSRSDCYHVDNFDTVRAKANTEIMLYNELRSKRKKGVVGIGAMSDTYNPFEKELEITRQALQQIANQGFGVCIETKSDMILRDIDLLKQITRQHSAIVKLTVTTWDDALSRKIEPYAPVSSIRLKAIKKMSDEGLYAGMLMMPLLPFINDSIEDIKKLVALAYDHHVRFIYPSFGVTLRANQREHYFQQLNKLYPGMRHRYVRTYGEKYSCDSPQAKLLAATFKQECQRFGIPYKMKDIIKGYKKAPDIKQLQLF